MTDQEPTNVLVVDDLPEKLLVYRTILDGLGLNLVTAGSGEEALRAVLGSDFAVILLDVNMPGMSGLEAAGLIRRRKRSAHTPIIFLTAFADEVRATEGYEQGAVDYISTPVVPAILRAKVKVFADLYRMTQQVRRQAEERIALAAERSRREAAEEANRRLAFLTHAGAVLGGTLDPDQAARDTLRLALSYLADTAVLVHPPADRRGWRALRGRTTGGEPALDADVGRDALDSDLAAAVDRALAGATAAEGLALAVPLRARGQVIAVLGLARRAAAGPLPDADVPVAETLASRAAMALENARLYRDLQTADRQKNEFLSMLAHELRNPLAPIRSATEVLGHGSPDPARVRWAYGVIDRQVTQLVRLVDDLLDVSRITLGKIRLASEVVELAATVAQAVEAVRPLIDKFGHRLSVGELPAAYVRGDPTRLIQVFANLLNNAAKYTDPGGSVTVTAALVGAADRVEVRVRDTGVGISADLLPAVFDLFTQASRSLDRSQGGLGVGLTLVRRLVEMHGGAVTAASDGPGRGSEFVVTLPVTADRPADRLTAVAAGPRGPLKVLVIDDNVDAAESLADLIAMLGHAPRVAHDGPAGIAAAAAFRPDVVLLDIGLPGMDGYEVARRLRADAAAAVLVAVSGYGREEDRAAGRAAGFAHHFVKPIDFGTLQAVFAAAGSEVGADAS
jgi:signal transduction histidine kinase/DNA-binding response OmpR family regulator